MTPHSDGDLLKLADDERAKIDRIFDDAYCASLNGKDPTPHKARRAGVDALVAHFRHSASASTAGRGEVEKAIEAERSYWMNNSVGSIRRDIDASFDRMIAALASPPAAETDFFRCNCPHEVRSGCSEPKCPHYTKPRALAAETAGQSWSRIDSELSAYVSTIRADLIEQCAKEAERCDTHKLHCIADPRAVRSDVADRIRALASAPAAKSAACKIRGAGVGEACGTSPMQCLAPAVETAGVDARRYQRLRVLGCAPAYTDHLKRGDVMRFTNLDEFVDKDVDWTPSRGEATPADTSASVVGAWPLDDRQLWENSCITRGQLKCWTDEDIAKHPAGMRRTVQFLLSRLDALTPQGKADAGRKWDQGEHEGCGIDSERAFHASVVGEREAIARIIEPECFIDLEREREWCTKHNRPLTQWAQGHIRRCEAALTKAGAILALTSQGKADAGGAAQASPIPVAGQGASNHTSDCAVHNEPALPSGPCDCGADATQALKSRLHPFAYYFDLNDCDGRADDEALEIPIRDIRAARDLLKSLGMDTLVPLADRGAYHG